MQIAHSLAELDSKVPSVVTIGNFDGVHCGHQAILSTVRTRAAALGARSVALTFDPHPAQLTQSGAQPSLLSPLPCKLELLAATGIDLALVLPFTEALRCLSAFDFAESILCHGLNTREIHEGENFRFGHRAEGDIPGLTRLGEQLCFAVQVHAPLQRRGAPVSSSRIRRLISQGRISAARALLGRPFSVDSTPAPGRGYGTRYAVPTVNLAPYPALLPAHGVYITMLRIGSGPDSRLFRGVTNAGNRPTFGADSYAVETHLFDFEPVTLEATTPIRLTFLERLRGEQRFASPDALREQIGLDVRRAQRYFHLCDLRACSTTRL